MKASLTRKEFLQLFIPPWVTKLNLKIAGVVAVVIVALSISVSFFQHLGLPGTLKLLAVVLTGAVVLWLLAKSIESASAFFQKIRGKIPSSLVALLVVLGRWIPLLLYGALGAWHFHRWQQGSSLIGPALSLAAIFLAQYLAECTHRSARIAELR